MYPCELHPPHFNRKWSYLDMSVWTMKTSSFSHIRGTDTTLPPNRLHLRCTRNSPVLQSAWQAYHSPLLHHTLVNVISNNNNCWQQLTCWTHFHYTPVHLSHLITDYINVTADFICCKFQWIALHCSKLQYPSNTIHFSQGPLPTSQKDLPSSTKLTEWFCWPEWQAIQ